jgi:hypothetical protein
MEMRRRKKRTIMKRKRTLLHDALGIKVSTMDVISEFALIKIKQEFLKRNYW